MAFSNQSASKDQMAIVAYVAVAAVLRLMLLGDYEAALRIWARRSRALIANPRRADKDLWWGFGQKRSTDEGS